MGRKSKYSKELKLEIIYRAMKGESKIALSNEYNLGNSGRNRIRIWVKQYESVGDEIFDNLSYNKSYTKELKMAAINDYLAGLGSIEEISIKYNISSHSVLNGWISKYNNHIEVKDYFPTPEVYMAKSRKTTFEEKIEIVNYCIENDYNYKKAATIYNTTYTQVFNWVRKYKESGADSLIDNRGKRKNENSLTDLEKLRRENEILKSQLKHEKMKNEVLKKLEELERRENRNIKLKK